MTAWKSGLLELLEPLFGDAGSPLFFVLIVLALVAYLLVLQVAAKAMGIERRELPHLGLATFLGVSLFLAATIAGRIYVPLDTIGPKWQLPVVATVAFLVLALPAYCLVLRANYIRILFSLLMSVAAAAIVVAMVSAMANAVTSGGKSGKAMQSRKKEVEDFVNK